MIETKKEGNFFEKKERGAWCGKLVLFVQILEKISLIPCEGKIEKITEMPRNSPRGSFTEKKMENCNVQVKQRQCGECKGSGLVLRTDQQYVRCPACGIFSNQLSVFFKLEDTTRRTFIAVRSYSL